MATTTRTVRRQSQRICPAVQKERPPQDVPGYLSNLLEVSKADVDTAVETVRKNVKTVLRRQIDAIVMPDTDRPLCSFLDEQRFVRALRRFDLQTALLTLARAWDEGHIALCKTRSAAREGKEHDVKFLRNPCVDFQHLTDTLERDPESINGKIVTLKGLRGTPLDLRWQPCLTMSFDDLPRLESLADALPGELTESSQYAGIGGGGGSDVISASLLGQLLRPHKKSMDFLVSTRTWATGSQGKEGDVIGVPRVVHNPAGHAEYEGKTVPGTFRIGKDTRAEGRDLETIPLKHFPTIHLVLDQGESKADIPEQEHVRLEDQFNAILAAFDPVPTLAAVGTGGNSLDNATSVSSTVISVDTGGDVFGADETGRTTPEQDLRVQMALNALPPVRSRSGKMTKRNLVTAVVAPGVDAPANAPQTAKQAGGKVYTLTKEERLTVLETLAEYKMDGSDPTRYGKTTLALQECLRGKEGWTSLDLPEHVVNTWENPWSSFVFIQKCMGDVIFMPTTDLLPLITPASGVESNSDTGAPSGCGSS